MGMSMPRSRKPAAGAHSEENRATIRYRGPRRPGDRSPIDDNPVAHLSAVRFSAGVDGKAMLMATHESKVEWQPTNAMFKGVRMIGIIGGSMGDALELMQAGRIKTEPLTSHVFPLDRITEDFEMQSNPHEAVKAMVKP